MEVSRITIRKETMEKLKKGLNPRERGRILWGRLVELEKDGTLGQVRNRKELVKVVGYPEGKRKSGISWVGGLIQRGHLEEILDAPSKDGRAEFRYYLTNNPPDYDYVGVQHRHKQIKEARIGKVIETSKATENTIESPKVAETKMPIRLELTKGDLSIKVELDDNVRACDLILAIMKGEK